MNPGKKLSYLYCRSAAARFLTWLSLLLIVIIVSLLVGHNVQKKPVISSINPTVGSPGDIMIIDGENFGATRGTSYVELGGSRITASGYLTWTDMQIKIILPSNVQDGLVVVGTSAGRSTSEFFANEAGIPVVVMPEAKTLLPVIDQISPNRAAIGQIITINGANFGETQDDSVVFFTSGRDDQGSSGANTYVPVQNNSIVNQAEFLSAAKIDYVSWSDTQIKVRVPEGTAPGSQGQIYISTSKGSSGTKKFTLDVNAGRKYFSGKRTYIIQLSADVTNAIASQDALITLNVPRPQESCFEPEVELTECYPEPLVKEDSKIIVHQKQLNQLANRKQRFTQNFVISNYTITTSIRSQRLIPFDPVSHPEFKQFLEPDQLVPSDDQLVNDLRVEILGNSTNPFLQARLIYNYFLNKFKIENEVRTGNVSPLDLINNKSGDAYDFAVLYTAVCRSAGIPAVPVSGVLIEDRSQCRNHWWVEIYFENFGWYPVDVALGAGLEYNPYVAVKDPATYYFGNLDSQHVSFSHGWNEVKPLFVNSKIVYRPRTYALQSIWEEATEGTTSYSSLWNDPVILGIY